MHGDGKHCLDKVVAVTPEAERMLKSQSAVLWNSKRNWSYFRGICTKHRSVFYSGGPGAKCYINTAL